MRYDDQDRESKNVEDRRGQAGGFQLPGGRGIQIPIGGGGMSITTMLIVGAIMLLFGLNPLDLLRGAGPGSFPDVPQMPRQESSRPTQTSQRSPLDIPGLPGGQRGAQPGSPVGNDEMKVFMGRVLADTEDVWGRVFQSFGKNYEAPKLVLFSRATPTACGTGQSAMGPFYCPLDRKIYVDLVFYEELKRRFQAPGDFAQAYVIAHEVGHHVQNLLGISGKVQQMRQSMSKRDGNALSVRTELQADCFAGVWANRADRQRGGKMIDDKDVEQALAAAAAIGDDALQKQSQGRVVPDSFTHGTSAQRARWFRIGLESGDPRKCDTFRAQQL